MVERFITSKQTPTPPRNTTPDLQSVRIALGCHAGIQEHQMANLCLHD